MNFKHLGKMIPVNHNLPVFTGNQGYEDLQVFRHHIYEFKKGLRNLVLTTEKAENKEAIEQKLKKEKISYIIQKTSDKKINVFFGKQACIDVVSTFNNQKLNELEPEQDFILGIMLGYDQLEQCRRYLKMKNENRN